MQAAQASYEQDGPQIFHQKAHVETAPEMGHTYVSVLNAVQLSSQYQCIFSYVPKKNGLFGTPKMATVLLFWDTNMVAVT